MSVPRPAIWVDTVTVAELAGLGDDAGLLGVVLGVEHDRRDAGLDQPLVQLLGLGDVVGADQDRLAGRVHLGDVLDDGVVLRRRGDVHPVGLVLADVGRVRRDWRDAELVELPQLLADGQRGAGHAAHRRISADQRLHGDGVEHLAGLGGLDALLRLDGGLQAVGPALQLGDAAAGGVDQVHRAVADDVVDVALQQHMGVQRDVDLGQRGADVLLGVQVDAAELGLELLCAGLGQVDVAAVGVGVVVLARRSARRPAGRSPGAAFSRWVVPASTSGTSASSTSTESASSMSATSGFGETRSSTSVTSWSRSTSKPISLTEA